MVGASTNGRGVRGCLATALGTLSDVHQSSMMLVINMDAAGKLRCRLTPIINLQSFLYLYIYFVKT